jgi:hypothetical protein
MAKNQPQKAAAKITIARFISASKRFDVDKACSSGGVL